MNVHSIRPNVNRSSGVFDAPVPVLVLPLLIRIFGRILLVWPAPGSLVGSGGKSEIWVPAEAQRWMKKKGEETFDVTASRILEFHTVFIAVVFGPRGVRVAVRKVCFASSGWIRT